MTEESICSTHKDPPILARFRPKNEYMSTFDMLHDSARNQAYSQAVRLLAAKVKDRATMEVVRWLDIGTGSGLLASLVAAAAASPSSSMLRAGTIAPKTTAGMAQAPKLSTEQPSAATPATPAISAIQQSTKVYACEGVEEVADVATKTFEKHGESVSLFRGRSTEIEVGRDLPCRVPLVISELLGTGLLEEGILPTLRDAKTRLLSPGYISIPHSAEVWAFCCESSELHSMSRLLPSASQGNEGAFRPPSSERWEHCPGTAAPVSLHARFRPRSSATKIFSFDFSSGGSPLPGPEGRTCTVQFPIDAVMGGGGVVHAIVCWWRCLMDEGRTIVMSTSPQVPPKVALDEDPYSEEEVEGEYSSWAPPLRDHWRQSVHILSRPVAVRSGDAVHALACHNDNDIWFKDVELEDRSSNSNQQPLAGFAACRPPSFQVSDRRTGGHHIPGAAMVASFPSALIGPKQVAEFTRGSGGVRKGEVEGGQDTPKDTAIAQESRTGLFPPACVCGLHRTCPPSRIWMLNDPVRTATFRSAVQALILDSCGRCVVKKPEEHQQGKPSGAESAAVTLGAMQGHAKPMSIACISDGFLLPLLAAQEGATEVLEIQPSAGYRGVCRDVYRANGVDVGVDGKDRGKRGVIRPFPGGVSSVYELLEPLPASYSAENSGFGLAGKKIDAIIGEPFFADLSTAAWPLEPLLLFWCVRTALEARGCFSPRTRVLPTRARLLACPFACDLLYRGRRPVGTVEGINMSAVNHGLGCRFTPKPGWNIADEQNYHDKAEDEEAGKWRPGDVESIRLSEHQHELLGPSTVVLDMDLARPLCDLRGSRKEICCSGGIQRRCTKGARTARGLEAPKCRGEGDDDVVCHGVALWLDIWLDEEGLHRLSTGLEVPYWPQGILFFDEGYLVPPCGGSFHLEVALEDGALRATLS